VARRVAPGAALTGSVDPVAAPDEPYYAPGWPAPRARTRGRWLARAGVALGVLGTLALIGVVVGTVLTARDSRALPPDVAAPRAAHARQLVTGSCLDPLPSGDRVDAVRVVPCREPHAAQVFTEYAFDPAAIWPGQARADAQVAGACRLTVAEQAAGVRALAWAPTPSSWSRGDRRGLCLATTDAGKLTGSFLDDTGISA
jgi:hypothetical protein